MLGVLALAAIPVGVLITQQRSDLRLLHAGVAVPVAAVLGIVAIRLAKRARQRLERTLGRAGAERRARAGRFLGWFTLYLALIGSIALAVYAVEYYLLS